MGLLISAYRTIPPPKYGNFAQIVFRVFPFTYIDKKNPEVLQCFGIFFADKPCALAQGLSN